MNADEFEKRMRRHENFHDLRVLDGAWKKPSLFQKYDCRILKR